MTTLSSMDYWLLTVGGLFTARSALVLLAAEQGRKRDLVKRLFTGAIDFPLAVVIVASTHKELQALPGLLRALEHQNYPTSKISIHIGVPATATEAFVNEAEALALPPYARLWQCADKGPKGDAATHHLRAWLTDRVLASSTTGLLVFLQPSDLIKPDFLMALVSKAFEENLIQGYTATRISESHWGSRLVSLHGRLNNRIQQAGRFHAGLAIGLQASGFAIKPDLLEKLPWKQGNRYLSPTAYAMELLLRGVSIAWAPSVVTFCKGQVSLSTLLWEPWQALGQRLTLLLHYGLPLFWRGLLKGNINLLERSLCLAVPSASFTFVLLLLAVAIKASLPQLLPGAFSVWLILLWLQLIMQSFTLLVARSQPADFMMALLVQPLIKFASIVLGPFLLLSAWRKSKAEQVSLIKLPVTRFNEAFESEAESHLTFSYDELLESKIEGGRIKTAQKEHAEPATTYSSFDLQATAPLRPQPVTLNRAELPLNTLMEVPLSNGHRQIMCLLKTETLPPEQSGDAPHYCMILEYKGHAFKTEPYRILDQAYYDLQTKLMAKGLRLLSCGSCGYFYNPSADRAADKAMHEAGGFKHHWGYCLFGKLGKDIKPDTDAITVVSQACDYHTPLEERPRLVKAWLESTSAL